MRKELMEPGNLFPVEITAYDFAAGVTRSRFKFGLSLERTIMTLRDLADRLESKKYILQGVESGQKVLMDDFTMSSVTITYAEKREADELLPEPLNNNNKKVQAPSSDLDPQVLERS